MCIGCPAEPQSKAASYETKITRSLDESGHSRSPAARRNFGECLIVHDLRYMSSLTFRHSLWRGYPV
jgi:hypothetical protein